MQIFRCLLKGGWCGRQTIWPFSSNLYFVFHPTSPIYHVAIVILLSFCRLIILLLLMHSN